MRGFGEVAERLRRSTVQVHSRAGRGSGSGVVWSSDGLVITNAHVARSADLEVELWDGRRLPARMTHARCAPRPGRAARRVLFARCGRRRQFVVAPAGRTGDRRRQPAWLCRRDFHRRGPFGGADPRHGHQGWIRARVRLAPGNSGGPLANAEGRVVGINTAIVNGLGVAVPANSAAQLVQALRHLARAEAA